MTIGIREFKNRATQILRSLEERGSSIVVTRRGRPTALILPIDSPEAEDYVLAHAPEIVESLTAAEMDFADGHTVTLGDYRAGRGV